METGVEKKVESPLMDAILAKVKEGITKEELLRLVIELKPLFKEAAARLPVTVPTVEIESPERVLERTKTTLSKRLDEINGRQKALQKATAYARRALAAVPEQRKKLEQLICDYRKDRKQYIALCKKTGELNRFPIKRSPTRGRASVVVCAAPDGIAVCVEGRPDTYAVIADEVAFDTPMPAAREYCNKYLPGSTKGRMGWLSLRLRDAVEAKLAV